MALLLTFWKSTFFYIVPCSFSTSITMLCTDISHLNIKFMTFKSNYQSSAVILAFWDICKKFGQIRSAISYLEILLSINQTSKWKENTDDKNLYICKIIQSVFPVTFWCWVHLVLQDVQVIPSLHRLHNNNIRLSCNFVSE